MRRYLIVGLVALALTACQPDATLGGTIAASNTQLAASVTALVHNETSVQKTAEYGTQTPTPSATPTVTLTPCCGDGPVTVTPHEAPRGTPVDHIIEVDTQEIDWLAALCQVEVANYGDKRAGACASVVDTVFERIRQNKMTGGDVFSTITWGCNEGTEFCQFPRYALDGCQGIIPDACPLYDTESLIYFRGVILGYLTGDITPTCGGYLFYGIKPHDLGECEIETPSGVVQGWHN